jgi:hypothetical protein
MHPNQANLFRVGGILCDHLLKAPGRGLDKHMRGYAQLERHDLRSAGSHVLLPLRLSKREAARDAPDDPYRNDARHEAHTAPILRLV